jgi:hypothetical protein
MKQYFAKVTSCYWTEKNALHGAMLEMIKGMDCTLFSESELEDFVKALYDSVDILNSKFKRCKPFKLEVMSEVEKHYYISGVFHINIYEVAREFKCSDKLPIRAYMPLKDEAINQGYNIANGCEYSRRNVLKNASNDLYYTGWMDCFEWITK